MNMSLWAGYPCVTRIPPVAQPIRTRLVVAVLAVVAACGGDDVNHLADAPLPPDGPADAAIDADLRVELTTTIAGTGMGTVTSSPAGITCTNGTCSGDFDPDTVVTLTAVPDTGSVFVSWSGACTGTLPTCEVTLAQAASVTATFDIAQYAVTVTKAGAGMGTVMGGGIDCGATCTMMVDHGTMLSLTATPANLSVFAGWGGACSGTAGCTVTVTAPTTITANFPLDTLTLFVSKGGNGAGTVTATGINCGTDCDETYTAGQMVTLTAAASTGSTFTGWSGGGCTGTGTCTVTMTAAITVTATFTLQQFALTVTRAGNGSGNVASTPAGIACGTDCMENLNYNTMVTLTATPSTGSTFTGWSGACTGTAMCMVTMTQARSVTATFTLQQFALTTSVTGNGTITSSPAGINCGTDCTQSYNYGQVVALTATAGTGSTFMGWGGACSGTGACSVTIDAAKNVTATFSLNMYTLTVAKNGTGMGTVAGTGINCGGDCMETVNFGTVITLTPTAATGSTFMGWSGGGCTGTGACTVTVSAATTVTATFDLQRFTVGTVLAGNGTGTVTSLPAGVSCPGDCSEIYNYGQMVTLTAAAGTGSTFTGWSGGGCSGTAPCVVTVSAATSVTATFTLRQFAVTVTRAGGGTGTVTSSPAGINCPADCTENYNYNQLVTLTAAPATGSTFTGWSGGGCTGTTTCIVQVTAVTNVTATFGIATFNLGVTLAGLGGGTVTSAPAGITCGADCNELYNYNTSVALTAMPDANSDFGGWSGACTGTGACTVSMTQARSVTATFNRKIRTLSITFSGDGAGTVTANGQTCSASCNLTFPHGTAITMSATPANLDSNLSRFTGWTGAGCSGTGGCSFTITAATTVIATFRLNPNIMFTTSRLFDGNLGNLDGADAKCQAAAQAAGLRGSYRAYLGSSSVGAAVNRFAGARGWVRTDGLAMINGIGQFGTINLPAPPILDENGASLAQSQTPGAWTATNADTTYMGQNCNAAGQVPDWTTTSARTLAGDIRAQSSAVLNGGGTLPCASTFHLYCFGVDRAATVP